MKPPNILRSGLCFVGDRAARCRLSRVPLSPRRSFGTLDDQEVEIYTLTNAHGVEARITTYGATLVSLKTPDRDGHLQNIVLGFDSLEGYVADGVPYYGATVGRYANRIAAGRFTIDGTSYQLPLNDGPNSLHGGKRGFDKRLWTAGRQRQAIACA